MENLCKNIGFRKVEIKTYYRATDYFSFFVPVFMIIAIFENLFKFFDLKVFASGIILVAKKQKKRLIYKNFITIKLYQLQKKFIIKK